MRMFSKLPSLLFVLPVTALFAQTEKATLRGLVTDPTGAIVPDTVITVTEVATNIERRTASDANGNYEVPDLKPGIYRVKADKTGFRSHLADSVLLDAGQVRRVDIALQVGATTETITVSAGAALITTDTGVIGGELDKKKFADRPLVDVYPSPLAMLTTVPGIQGNGWNLVISGQGRNQQTWAMDGIANDTTGDQNDNPSFFETVQVTTTSAGADGARLTNFNMVSKSGTNGFHGGVYYQHENSALNARLFFDQRKTPYILHEFEMEQGGRIIKDRTFFFVAWFHQSIPLGFFVLRSMPTLNMRAGDFSQFSRAITDPTNGQAFPNKVIPASRFNDVSKKVMDAYMPVPNIGGPDNLTNNFGWTFPYNSDLYKGDWPFFRIDHKVSAKNNLYVRWMQRKTPYILPGATPPLTFTSSRDHRQTVVSDTHLFSANLVNSFSFGHQTDLRPIGQEEKGFTPLAGDDVVKAIGLQGVNPRGYHTQGFPQMTINGLSTLSSNSGGIDNINENNGINTYQDTLTWSKGKHVFKTGAEYRQFWQLSKNISTQVYGNFNFNASISGVGFADFLLGLPFSSTRLDPLVARRNTNKQIGLFLTDTFKVTQKLTLDYGLRWDYYALPTYDDGLMYNWDPATGNVLIAPGATSKVHPLYPKTITIVSGKVVPAADRKNFRPRISAAYRMTNKLVLRGGYGEYSEVWGYFSRLLSGGPFQLGETYNNVITNGTPLFSFPNPFPSSLSSAAVPSQSITAYPLQTDNGVIRQYSFTVEREFRDMGLRVSYIGSRGSGLNYNLDINKPPASTIPFTTSRRPMPQFNGTTVTRTDGLWHYDSLQVQGQRRIGSLTFNAHWTWSNNMNNYSVTEDPYNVTSRWSRDPNDRRHYVSLSSTWAVPVGRGRRFLTSAPGVVDRVLGGWGLQYISYFATGGYFSPAYSGSDPSNTNTVGGLPDRIANGNRPPDQRTKTQWFDPLAFKTPAPGHFGNSGVNILQGQGINVHHLSVAKTFAITERFKTTFTTAISNLFNHPHFNNPNNNITNPNPGQFTSIVPDYNPEKQSNRHIAMKLRLEW